MVNTRIAKNDPRLAHALAGRALGAAQKRIGDMMARAGDGGGPKKLLRELREMNRGMIVAEFIARDTTSRPQWAIVFAAPAADHGLELIAVAMNNNRRRTYPVALVTSHAIARAMQRTVGRADLKEVFAMLHPHLRAIVKVLILRRAGPGTIEAINGRGALCGEIESDLFAVLKTWIDHDGAADHSLRTIGARAGDDVALRGTSLFPQP